MSDNILGVKLKSFHTVSKRQLMLALVDVQR